MIVAPHGVVLAAALLRVLSVLAGVDEDDDRWGDGAAVDEVVRHRRRAVQAALVLVQEPCAVEGDGRLLVIDAHGPDDDSDDEAVAGTLFPRRRHRLLLNKFPVVDDHALLVTRDVWCTSKHAAPPAPPAPCSGSRRGNIHGLVRTGTRPDAC